MENTKKPGDPVVYNVNPNASIVRLDGGIQRPGCLSGVLVKALAANGAPVYIGGPAVSAADGFELGAGQVQFFPHDPNALYVFAAASQNVRVMVL